MLYFSYMGGTLNVICYIVPLLVVLLRACILNTQTASILVIRLTVSGNLLVMYF